MTTTDARKRLAEWNAATQADTSVEALTSLVLDALHSAHHQPGNITMHDLAAHVAAALADALNGAGVTGGGAS